MAVQRLGLCASKVGHVCSIPGQGTGIPHAMWHSDPSKKTPKTTFLKCIYAFMHFKNGGKKKEAVTSVSEVF